jgi:uncharacterized protein YdaU (DUF1376 family)
MMRAAWWWIDRWRKSTAYMCMNAEEQGLYRNLLDACWLFPKAIIPDDERTLMMASGGEPEAWARSRKKVLKWMQKVPGGWTNETAKKVIKDYLGLRYARAQAGRKGGLKTQAKLQANHQAKAQAKTNPPSPSPSPSLVSIGVRMPDSLTERGGNPPPNPFIPAGGRPSLESECLNLVRRMSELTGEDALEIIARASGYEGAKRTKLNPASMTDDRLLNTLRDLRADVAVEEDKHAKKHT